VSGFGERKAPKAFMAACDKFIYVENLAHTNTDAGPASTPLKLAQRPPAAKLKSGRSGLRRGRLGGTRDRGGASSPSRHRTSTPAPTRICIRSWPCST
jgi:hypothetical protein